MSPRLLFLELNEVNFDYIERYCANGLLPNFRRLLKKYRITRTKSEQRPEHIEPWIQWVTAHTGLPLASHGVFRLGDIVTRDLTQIWEMLEQHGLKVGAVSPMNAKNRLRAPAFFVPDPWTSTNISGPRVLQELCVAIAQAVNDNAQARLTLASALRLAAGIAAYARPKSYAFYARCAASAKRRPWRKAIFLDQLLADVFVKETRRTRPDYASLFLNAAAHIQHHYMFSSLPYDGPHRNPAWYAPPGVDPVLEVYQSYDRIVGEIEASFPSARLMLATGLHQVPHTELTYYWRLKDHATFLKGIGIDFTRCEPRMSRDFLVGFVDQLAATKAAHRLMQARSGDGMPLFEVDNRGYDLFVTLSYARDIGPEFLFHIESQTYRDLQRQVAFVALKNGAHDGIGYLIDTAKATDDSSPAEISLSQLPNLVAEVFGLHFSPDAPFSHQQPSA